MVADADSMSPPVRRAGLGNALRDDLVEVVTDLEPFWDGRDTGFLHQALYLHEFGETAFVVRGEDGKVHAYLLGFVTPARVGYIHAVAVRRDKRGRGLARTLYHEFERAARKRGAIGLKAITHPSNTASIEFHRSLGFTVQEVDGYSFLSEPRVVFRRDLG